MESRPSFSNSLNFLKTSKGSLQFRNTAGIASLPVVSATAPILCNLQRGPARHFTFALQCSNSCSVPWSSSNICIPDGKVNLPSSLNWRKPNLSRKFRQVIRCSRPNCMMFWISWSSADPLWHTIVKISSTMLVSCCHMHIFYTLCTSQSML